MNTLILITYLFISPSNIDKTHEIDLHNDKVIDITDADQNLPIVSAIGGYGRSVRFSKFNIRNPSPELEKELERAGSYFINGCDRGPLGEIKLRSVSSVLVDQSAYNYAGKNLIDMNPTTSWVEGAKGMGIGEWFEVKSNDINTIFNGYQSSPGTWQNNARVKRFKVSMDGKALCYLDLKDEMGEQNFELPFEFDSEKSHVFRFEIQSVYKGLKFEDVCISEIGNQGCCINAADFPVMINIEQAKKTWNLTTLDSNHLQAGTSTVEKYFFRNHASLITIKTATGSLSTSLDHTFNVEGFGFISLHELSKKLGVGFADIPSTGARVLVHDGEKTFYTPITSMEVKTGAFRTVSVRSLEKGRLFVLGGFVHRTE